MPVEGTKADELRVDAGDKMSGVIVGSVSSAARLVFQQTAGNWNLGSIGSIVLGRNMYSKAV